MSDSSEVDAAVIDALVSDGSPGLSVLCPDGVFMDIAPPGAKKFVIVSLVTSNDEYAMGGCAYEKLVYLVKAVANEPSGATVKAAADRIHQVLQDVTLSISGYGHMRTEREERVRYTEVDEVDASIRWQHRGGRYAVWVSPTT